MSSLLFYVYGIRALFVRVKFPSTIVLASTSLYTNEFVTLNLKQDNYPLWKEQVLGLIEGQDLFCYLTSEIITPSLLIFL